MPLEILTGPEVPALLKRAQQSIGEDAVVISVRRVTDGGRRVFEMVAADPVTAARQAAEKDRSRDGADVLIAAERPRAAAPVRPVAPARPATPDDAARFWTLGAEPAPGAAPRTPAPERPVRRRAWPFASAAPRRPERRPYVVALVGPTGAGKTTTLAKLANHAHAFAGRRAGLLCLDTYRIGGVEQARQYAELSKLPFEVAWEPRDIARALRRLRDREVVLVDTAGRGPRAIADLRETQERLLQVAPDEVHLVLPAGLQRSLARSIVSAHLPLGVTHLLVSKLDEYPEERGAFELARQFALPMRWVTDGQEVPRDLQPAPVSPGVPESAPALVEAR